MYNITKEEAPIKVHGNKKGESVYPFADLQVGECFKVPLDKRESVRVLAYHHSRELGRKFIVRTVDGVPGVYRIA